MDEGNEDHQDDLISAGGGGGLGESASPTTVGRKSSLGRDMSQVWTDRKEESRCWGRQD